MEHISKGVNGYVKYAQEYPFKNSLLCVDYPRRKMKYKDENENIIVDVGLDKLNKLFFESIHEQNENLAMTKMKEIRDQMIALPTDNGENEDILDVLEKNMLHLLSMKTNVKNVLKGKKSKFLNQFTEKLCKKNIVNK